MRETNEQLLAKRMLQLREQDGLGFGAFLRMHARKNLLRAVYLVAALALLASLEMWFLCAFMLGMFLGAFVRDFDWVRSSRRAWPFTKKVTDWDFVRELAEPADYAVENGRPACVPPRLEWLSGDRPLHGEAGVHHRVDDPVRSGRESAVTHRSRSSRIKSALSL